MKSELRSTILGIISHGEQEGIPCDNTADRVIGAISANLRIQDVPAEYVAECNCRDWTSDVRHHVWQHKPACEKFDPRHEMSIVQEKLFQAQLAKIMSTP